MDFNADILTRFHIAVRRRPEGDLDGVDAAVRSAGAGRADGAEVLLSIAWVRAQGLAAQAPDWEKRYDEMVEFSAGRGWVEERAADAGERRGSPAVTVPSLRVHCEWPAEAKFTVLDFTRTVHREGRWRVGLDRYAAPGLVAHGEPGTADRPGRAAVLEAAVLEAAVLEAAALEAAALEAAVPEAGAGPRYEIRHVLADGAMVAVHAQSIPPGESSGYAIVDLYRVSDGLIVEWWRVGRPGRAGD